MTLGTAALGLWSFFIAIYVAGGENLRRWKGDDERFIFGMLGVFFTVDALLPVDPRGTRTPLNLFKPSSPANKTNYDAWTVLNFLRRLLNVAAGAFNLYNAAAMSTEKTLSLQSSPGGCADTRYVAPAIASITYMAAVLPAGERARAVAVSLPISALLTLLFLHTGYIDGSSRVNRFTWSVVFAVLAGVFFVVYSTMYLLTMTHQKQCHKPAKRVARFLEVLNPALAATFGWFYWYDGWSASLDPPFEKYIIPLSIALVLTVFRFVFFAILSKHPWGYSAVANEQPS